MASEGNELLEVHLTEYKKLKDEQIQRIGFRDNLIYVTLVAVGGIISVVVSSSANLYALLLVPWVCIILGWTYLVNDEKISAIGRYIRLKLSDSIRSQLKTPEAVFGWEIEHRSDTYRWQRKATQCLIDELTFCISGVVAVAAYLLFDKARPEAAVAVSILDLVLLAALGIAILIYADFGRGR